MKSASWTRWIIAAGVSCAAAGVFFAFQSERHSFVTTTDFEFSFLEKVSLPVLLFGLALTFVGSALWSSHAQLREILVYGLGAIALAPLCLVVGLTHIHSWTALFVLAGADAMLIGGLLLVVAAVRRFSKHRYKPRPG